MRRNKTTVLTFAEKCKNILASNWQGSLNTIKADSKGSKGDIHTSKVKYILRRGQPYLWVPENDLHNVNTIIDERGSFAVTTPFPGRLGVLLKSLKKLPARIALSGDVHPLREDKAKSLAEKLQEVILSEQKATKGFSYTVSGVLSSSGSYTSRSDNLQELLGENERYSVYRFKLSFFCFAGSVPCSLEMNTKKCGIGIICNVFAETLSRLLLALCPNVTSSGIQFATAQLPLLELMDCGLTICDPNCPNPTADENDSKPQKTSGAHIPHINQKLIIKHSRLRKLSLWGCTGLDGLYLNCPQLNDLNLNSCRNLHSERLLLQCPTLESVHATGCQDMLIEAIGSQVIQKR